MDFTTNVVRALQQRLAELRYYHLRIDGKPGPGTSDAVIRFKRAHGLLPRDYIGPVTMARLWSPEARPAPPAAAAADAPPWLSEARQLLGTRETPGAANNPEIMGWARGLDQWYPGDDVPWCGLFVAHCMAAGAPDEPQAFNRLGARNWLQYGEAADGAPLGGVAVFWRTHPTKSWNGHVALITGQNDTHIRCIGGNQSDNVTEAWFDRSRLLGIRQPVGADLPEAPRATTGAISTNEA